jgi:BolA protein
MSVQQSIETKLAAGLGPEYLQVLNESSQHNVPPNSETHFKVVIVSPEFEEKRKVARHQAVYGLLAEELAGPVHALALHTYSPDEWSERQAEAPQSPACLGGSKSET